MQNCGEYPDNWDEIAERIKREIGIEHSGKRTFDELPICWRIFLYCALSFWAGVMFGILLCTTISPGR